MVDRNITSDIKKMAKDAKFYVLGVVTRSIIRKDKNNRSYWDVSVMDADGTIEGKVWNNGIWYACEANGAIDTIGDPLSDPRTKDINGKSIGFQGQVGEYKGQQQFTFNAVYYVDQDKYPPHSFVQHSAIPFEKMEKEFRELCASCTEPLKSFLDFVFVKKGCWNEFKDWPAAVTHHHAYVNGLLEHSIAVSRSAQSIAKLYVENGFPVNIDIVIAGALLHDIGKIEAYSLAPAPCMEIEGNVADHIALGYHRFLSLAEEYELDKKLTLALGHIILSHHGSKEFGSPVLPAIPEALIVAAADDLDFKLFCWNEAIAQLEDDKEVTEFHFAMQRRFWKGVSQSNGV